MAFDVNGARAAGYSDQEIAEYLAKKRDFNLSGALAAGYDYSEVLAELTKPEPKPKGKPTGIWEGMGRNLEGSVGNILGTGAAIPGLAALAEAQYNAGISQNAFAHDKPEAYMRPGQIKAEIPDVVRKQRAIRASVVPYSDPDDVSIGKLFTRPQRAIPAMGEQALYSLPSMLPFLAGGPIGATITAADLTGDVAYSRADANKTREPTATDWAVATPVGLASAALEKIGAAKVLGPIAGGVAARSLREVPREMLRAGTVEALTEAGQEALQYTGSTVGTATPFSASTMLRQAEQGALVGGFMGAGVRGPVGVAEVGANRLANSMASPAAPGGATTPDAPFFEPGSPEAKAAVYNEVLTRYRELGFTEEDAARNAALFVAAQFPAETANAPRPADAGGLGTGVPSADGEPAGGQPTGQAAGAGRGSVGATGDIDGAAAQRTQPVEPPLKKPLPAHRRAVRAAFKSDAQEYEGYGSKLTPEDTTAAAIMLANNPSMDPKEVVRTVIGEKELELPETLKEPEQEAKAPGGAAPTPETVTPMPELMPEPVTGQQSVLQQGTALALALVDSEFRTHQRGFFLLHGVEALTDQQRAAAADLLVTGKVGHPYLALKQVLDGLRPAPRQPAPKFVLEPDDEPGAKTEDTPPVQESSGPVSPLAVATKPDGKPDTKRRGAVHYVTLTDGTVVELTRDTHQFGSNNPQWSVDDPLSAQRSGWEGYEGSLGSTLPEALARLPNVLARGRAYAAELKAKEPAKTVAAEPTIKAIPDTPYAPAWRALQAYEAAGASAKAVESLVKTLEQYDKLKSEGKTPAMTPDMLVRHIGKRASALVATEPKTKEDGGITAAPTTEEAPVAPEGALPGIIENYANKALSDFMVGDQVAAGNVRGTVTGIEGDKVRVTPHNAKNPKAYFKFPKKSVTLEHRPDTTTTSSKSAASDDKFGTEAGELKMDQQALIKLLGANMYASDMANVTIKELLQNAFDAVKGAVSGKKAPSLYSKGKIKITMDYASRTISVEDNARGMTPNIVRDAFFTLAGSDKSDLDPSERSGGLGLAKLGFMLGAETISLDTVRDGVRVTVNTTAEGIASNSFDIVKSPAPPSEHGTKITVKVPKTYTDPRTGESKNISFPFSARSIRALTKPLIGPVEVTVDNGSEEVLPIGSNFPVDDYQKFSVKFDWGSADIYMGHDYVKYPTHSVLSSGVYQFDTSIKLNASEAVPYDIIVDVKPNVTATHMDYPFENSRERFKPRLDDDIKAMYAYIAQLARGLEAENIKHAFQNVVTMPRVEAGASESTTPVKFLPKPEPSAKEAKSTPAETVTVKNNVVSGPSGVVLLDTKASKEETQTKKSFAADKAAPVTSDFLVEMDHDPKLPILHNNTTLSVGQDSAALFAKLGTLMVEMKEFLAASGMWAFDALSADNLFFAGVSLDKSYGGVHIKIPYKAVLLNPLYDWGARTLNGAAEVMVNTMIHEVAHIADMGHNVGHNTAMVRVSQYLADEGMIDYFRDGVLSALVEHESVYRELKNEFNRSTTKNVAKSLDADQDASASKETGGSGSGGDSAGRSVQARGGRGDSGTVQQPAADAGGGGNAGRTGSATAVDEDGETPSFARSADLRGRAPMQARSVAAVVAGVARGWTNSPRFIIVPTFADLPANIRKGAGDATAGVRGVTFRRGNDVYIVADQHTTPSEVKATVFHEALGHSGLQKRFGKALNTLLQNIYASNPVVKALTDKWLQDHPGEYEGIANRQAKAVEEVLAELSEKGSPQLPAVKRAFAALKDFFRSTAALVGMKVGYSDNDVLALLDKAHENIREGAATRTPEKPKTADPDYLDEPSFARAPRRANKKISKGIRAIQISQQGVDGTAATGDVEDLIRNALGKDVVGGHDAKDFTAALKANGDKLSLPVLQNVLKPLPTSAIIDWAGDRLPPLRTLQTLIQKKSGETGSLLTAASKIALRIRKFKDAQKGGQKLLAATMHAARLLRVDMTALSPTLAASVANDPIVKHYDAEIATPGLDPAKVRAAKAKRTLRINNDITPAFKLWTALGTQKGGHETYKAVRNYYRDMYFAMRAQLDANIQALPISAAAKKQLLAAVRLEQEGAPDREDKNDPHASVPTKKFPHEYFPFLRYGEYWLRVAKGPTGREFHTFENAKERDIMLHTRAKELGVPVTDDRFSVGNKLSEVRENFQTEGLMLQNMFSAVDKASLTDAKSIERLKDQMYQVYLMTLPERSIRKQFLHSENVTGASLDVFRNFQRMSTTYAQQLIGNKYATPIRLAVSSAYDAVVGRPPNEAALLKAFVDEMDRRLAFDAQERPDVAWADTLNRATFIYMLTAPATAGAQLTSIPMRVAPRLVSRYGYFAATKQLLKYGNIFKSVGVKETHPDGSETYTAPSLENSSLVRRSPLLKRAFAAGKFRDVFDTSATAILQNQRTPNKVLEKGLGNVTELFFRATSALFSAAENLSREVTYMSAFELEYKKNGGNFDAAVDSAVRNTNDTLGDYGESERAPIMKGPIGRVVFLFKMFAVNTTKFFLQNQNAIWRGKSIKERAEALHELSGVLLMGALFSGVTGLPLYGVTCMAVDMWLAAFGDEEDERERRLNNPYTADSSDLRFRYEWLPKHFGVPTIPGLDGKMHTLANVLEFGPVSELTDVNIGSRTAYNGMWWRQGAPADSAEEAFVNAIIANVAPVSMASSLARAVDDFGKGEIVRGLEKLSPAFARGALTAYRLDTEGAKTLRGDKVLAREEISDMNLIAQALGFQSTQLADAVKTRSAWVSRKNAVDGERDRVMRDFRLVATDPDRTQGDVDRVIARILGFNERYPVDGLIIDNDALEKSYDTHMRNTEMSINGTLFSKKEAPYAAKILAGPQ